MWRLLWLGSLASLLLAQSQTPTGFFYPTGSAENTRPQCQGQHVGQSGGWLDRGDTGCYLPAYDYHLGVDVRVAAVGSSVYSISDGQYFYLSPGEDDSWGDTDCNTYQNVTGRTCPSGKIYNIGLFVEHHLSDGRSFLFLYAHILNYNRLTGRSFAAGDTFPAGKAFAFVGNYSPIHLHTGVVPNVVLPIVDESKDIGFGRANLTNWPNTNSFVQPIDWIEQNAPSSTSPTCGTGTSTYTPAVGLAAHPVGTLIQSPSTKGTIYVLRYTDQHLTGLHRDGFASQSAFLNPYNQPYTGNQFNFNDVINISDTEMATYSIGGTFLSPQSIAGNGQAQPDGELITRTSGGTVAIVSNGHRREFPSADIFQQLGYQFCNVIQDPNYDNYPLGVNVMGQDGPTVAASVVLSPSPPYSLNENVSAQFGIENRGPASVTFDVLTLGGRLNADSSCANTGGVCVDFSYERSLTLAPGQLHTYYGSQQLSYGGSYGFSASYLVGSNWNTDIATDYGVSNVASLSVPNSCTDVVAMSNVTASASCGSPTFSTTPSSGQQLVTQFSYDGTGLTPNGSIQQWFQGPNGTTNGSIMADGNGNVHWIYTYKCSDAPGLWYTWISDPAKSFTSEKVTNQVSANLSCQTSMYTIGGQITVNGTGLAGVTVSLNNGTSIQTSGTGSYTFPNLPASGNYIVTPSLQGYSFNPASASLSNLSGNQTANFAATATLYTIGGQITLNGSGLAGVTISLNNGSSTQTNGNGTYAFSNLMASGNYTVTPTLPGYSFTPGTASFFNLSSNQSSNFAATSIVYTITGQITLNGSVLPDVTVSLNNGTTTQTNGNGEYSFGNLAAGGNYAVTPSLQGYGFVPGSASFLNLSGNQSANFIASSAAALRFVPVIPCRIADTRSETGPFGGPLITGGTSRDFTIPNSTCGIPATAQAYSLNVTAVPLGPLGYITVWPSGQAQPLVSTLNSQDGRVKANAAIVPAGANGAITIFTTNDTNVVLDIDGYFAPASSSTALAFYPLTPCRIADTRNASGLLGGPYMPGGQDRTFPVLLSSCNVPSSAQAYSLNFTVVPRRPLGYLTTFPSGQPQPFVSTLNSPTGAVTANAAIVPAGANGAVDVFVTNDTDLVVDINGYFAPPGSGGLSLYNVSPCRVLDTRNPQGSSPFSGAMDVNVTSSACAVSPTAQAYVFNATVVPSTPLGYLSLWPQGQTQPLVSTLNSPDGTVVANMAIVPTTNGLISAFGSNPTHLILDISGYFAP